MAATEPPGAPGPRQLLVRMLYAPINPADLLTIDGSYSIAVAPDAPLGAEGIAVVEAVGADVATVARGDRVLPLSRGNWGRFRLLAEDEVIVVPADLDPLQAAMLRINPATAWLMLRRAGVNAGDWLIQNGATSAVAHWVRVFASEMGVSVINLVRAEGSLDAPNTLIDGNGLVERVQAFTGDAAPTAALDCVAGPATGRLAACLAQGGMLILFGHLSGQPCQLPSQLLTGRDLTLRGFSLRPVEAGMSGDDRRALFERVFAAAGEPGNHMPVREVVPIEDADKAISLARERGRGRVILAIGG